MYISDGVYYFKHFSFIYIIYTISRTRLLYFERIREHMRVKMKETKYQYTVFRSFIP